MSKLSSVARNKDRSERQAWSGARRVRRAPFHTLVSLLLMTLALLPWATAAQAQAERTENVKLTVC